jgi:hypothetical protein
MWLWSEDTVLATIVVYSKRTSAKPFAWPNRVRQRMRLPKEQPAHFFGKGSSQGANREVGPTQSSSQATEVPKDVTITKKDDVHSGKSQDEKAARSPTASVEVPLPSPPSPANNLFGQGRQSNDVQSQPAEKDEQKTSTGGSSGGPERPQSCPVLIEDSDGEAESKGHQQDFCTVPVSTANICHLAAALRIMSLLDWPEGIL